MIGELIKLFRKERGVGVMELAHKLGINRISLFRIENSHRQPSEKTAIAALKALGISEENIYFIFVFNEMVRLGQMAKGAKKNDIGLWLRKLKKNDKDSKILYMYFQRILN